MTKTLRPSLTGDDARPPLKKLLVCGDGSSPHATFQIGRQKAMEQMLSCLTAHGESPHRTREILARAAPPRKYPDPHAGRDHRRQHSAGCTRAELHSDLQGKNQKSHGNGRRRLGAPGSCPCSPRSSQSSDSDTARSTRLDRPCGPRRSRHLHWKKPSGLIAGSNGLRSRSCIPCNREPNSIPYADAERGSRHRDSYRQRLSNCNECRTCVIRSNAAWQLRAAKPVLRARLENS